MIAAILAGACMPRVIGVGITVMDAPSPPPQMETAPLRVPLSAEAEAKLKEFLGKTREETVRVWNERMTKRIDEVVSVTGLGDEGRHALEAAAKQAVDAFADSWSGKMSDTVRMELNRQPRLAAMLLDQRLAQVEAYAASDWTSDFVEPSEQEVWIQALRQALNPNQAAAWDKSQAERKEIIEKEIDKPLTVNEDKIRLSQRQQILAACQEIEASAGLPKERSDKLEELATTVADQATELWRQRMERILLRMDDDRRKSFTEEGGEFVGMDPKHAAIKQAAWKDGVAALLTAEENKRLQANRDASRSKRAHALLQIMIALLDEKIAFTSSQREKLQPIAAHLVKNVPELYPDNATDMYSGYSVEMFYALTAGTEADVKPILDEIQFKHWRNCSEPDDFGVNNLKSNGDAKAEPPDVETAISSFLYEKEKNERKRLIEASSLKVEDVARVANLSAATKARLELAVRGAAEQELTSWRWFIEQQIRAQVQEATPQNIRQRLEGIQDFMFQQHIFFGVRGFQGTQADQGIWGKTVDVELDAKQKETWKKETDARAAFRDGAIAEFVVAEFDRRTQLTADQWAKIEPMIANIVKDCSPDISRVFSGNVWYLQGPYSLLPFAGVPDADLQAVLTKDQWDQWHNSAENTSSTNLWQNIVQIHKQRADVMLNRTMGN